MSLYALALVILAALTHATWNLLAKKAASAGPSFVFAYGLCATVIFAPWAIWELSTNLSLNTFEWSWPLAGCIMLSTAFHLGYSLSLQHGYQVADLSVVYPIARGSGPLLSTMGAFILLQEQPRLTGLTGMLCVVIGILMIATQGKTTMFKNPKAWIGIRWGMLIGLLIASYTVTDGYAVKVFMLTPVVLDWISHVLRTLILAPVMVRRRIPIRKTMRGYWGLAILVGILSPLSYILVLQALRTGAPLSLVAPTREMAMMVGTLMGIFLLREPRNPWRLAGCAVIICGVILLGAS